MSEEEIYPKREIRTLREGAVLPAGWMVVKYLASLDGVEIATAPVKYHVVVLENGHGEPYRG